MNKQEFLTNLKTKWYNENIVSYDTSKLGPLLITESMQNDLKLNPYLQTTTDIIHYYLILNSINHQFWSHAEDGSFVRYSYNNKVGAMALEQGLNTLVTEYEGIQNIPVLNTDIFKKHFGDMPNPQNRVDILNQALSHTGKECAKQLEMQINNGWTIMEALDIAQALPLGYKDEALKKAQLILHMASSALSTKNINVKTDLTCFADYQVPRVLRHLGVLTYSDELANHIDSGELIIADSKEENALRAATILACEELSKKANVSPEVLDYWLWSQRNSADKPFHLTYTTAY